jgi:DNA-directed RNA polymerase specialized sigma24 family protein
MSAPGSVTNWLTQLQAGDAAAAQPLWERYFRRMVALARKRLRGARRRERDEEDVALSALNSFCQGAMRGKFPQLTDRDNLWPLLVVITVRKAIDQIQRERRVGLGSGRERGDSVWPELANCGKGGLEQVVSDDPTPDFLVQVSEECHRLLDRLGDDEKRNIAVWKMEGHTNEEIAGRLGCARATVERRLRVIRKLWKEEDTGRGERPA